MIIKFIHTNGKKRQTKVESIPDFEGLRKLAVKIWGDAVSACAFGYMDSDEELITIVNQDDWEVCIEEMESLQEDKKFGKIIVRVLEAEEDCLMSESLRIQANPQFASQISAQQTELLETELSKLEDSTFNFVNEEDSTKEEVKEEATNPFDNVQQVITLPSAIIQEVIQRGLEITDQLNEWKMVENVIQTEQKEEEHIFEEPTQTSTQFKQTQEEESVFDDNSCPFKLKNTSQEDQLIHIDIDGNDLESLRDQIMTMAPMMGFEIERAEIVTNPLPTHQDLDVSVADTSRTSLTTDMREEIQKLIQAQVQEELRKNLSTPAPAPKAEEDSCKTVHHGITCDGCGVHPIVGVRFHSLFQQNFDLCSKCEKTVHTDHPMIRFRNNSHKHLAFGNGWQKMNKIMTNNGSTAMEYGRCTRNAQPQVVNPENVIEFFTNGVFNPARRNCSRVGMTIGDHIKQAAQKVESHLKKVSEEIKTNQTPVNETPAPINVTPAPVNETPRGRVNLCHIRSRVPVQVETPAPVPTVQRHARFEEFKKVFTNANPDELDEFLKSNDSLNNDNELYNNAISLFLSH